MAALAVLFCGWVGLAFALAGQVFTDATAGQFLLTWSLCGLTALALVSAAAMAHRIAVPAAPGHA